MRALFEALSHSPAWYDPQILRAGALLCVSVLLVSLPVGQHHRELKRRENDGDSDTQDRADMPNDRLISIVSPDREPQVEPDNDAQGDAERHDQQEAQAAKCCRALECEPKNRAGACEDGADEDFHEVDSPELDSFVGMTEPASACNPAPRGPDCSGAV